MRGVLQARSPDVFHPRPWRERAYLDPEDGLSFLEFIRGPRTPRPIKDPRTARTGSSRRGRRGRTKEDAFNAPTRENGGVGSHTDRARKRRPAVEKDEEAWRDGAEEWGRAPAATRKGSRESPEVEARALASQSCRPGASKLNPNKEFSAFR